MIECVSEEDPVAMKVSLLLLTCLQKNVNGMMYDIYHATRKGAKIS